MKEAFTIYVEDDEELLGIEGYFDVKTKSNIRVPHKSTYVCIDQNEIKENDGFLVTVYRHEALLVKDGEC